MTCRAGVARIVITPPVGVEISGYAFGRSVGILDDLQAQALVLDDGSRSAVIIAADLIGFAPELVQRLRTRISELGIREDGIMLAGSHTHSGPATAFLRYWGDIDETYLRALESQLVGLVVMAQSNVQEATFGAGWGRVGNVSENRRIRGGVTDPDVGVLRIDSASGEPLAVLYNFGCHPVSLHSYRRMISPDYPGYARQVIGSVMDAQAMGAHSVTLFTLGTAGDINPAGYEEGKTTPRRSRQIGSIVGCEVARVALGLEMQPVNELQVARAAVDLPIEPLPGDDDLRAMETHWASEAARLEAEGRPWLDVSNALIHRDWAREALNAREAGPLPRTRPCEMQALRLGDAMMLALPLEVFTETGLAIKAASPAAWTVVCSNSNGAMGYLPTRDAYGVPDYTNPQGRAPKVYGIYAFSPEAEPLLRSSAIALLSDLYQS